MEHVKVILLQRVSKLGYIGDIVNVKPGFARNYLLPQKIAMRATQDNLKYFENQKHQIEAANAETRAQAQEIAKKMENLSLAIVRQASDKGQLYGSVTNRDIAAAIKSSGFTVTAGQINLTTPIKLLGIYDIVVHLHPEVSVTVKLSVAKSEEEAKQQITELSASAKSDRSGKSTSVASDTSDTAGVSDDSDDSSESEKPAE